MIRMAFDSDRRDTGLRTRSLATENARPRQADRRERKRDAPDSIRSIPSLYTLVKS